MLAPNMAKRLQLHFVTLTQLNSVQALQEQDQAHL